MFWTIQVKAGDLWREFYETAETRAEAESIAANLCQQFKSNTAPLIRPAAYTEWRNPKEIYKNGKAN